MRAVLDDEAKPATEKGFEEVLRRPRRGRRPRTAAARRSRRRARTGVLSPGVRAVVPGGVLRREDGKAAKAGGGAAARAKDTVRAVQGEGRGDRMRGGGVSEELSLCVRARGRMRVRAGGVYAGVSETREKDGERAGGRAMARRGSGGRGGGAVSYTHLTLPTIYSV